MMKQLFPIKHVMGYVASLVLSAAALIVIYGDLSSSANMVVLLVTALIQASLQLFVFMHIGESADSKKNCISTSHTPCSWLWSPSSAPCSSSYGAGMLSM